MGGLFEPWKGEAVAGDPGKDRGPLMQPPAARPAELEVQPRR